MSNLSQFFSGGGVKSMQTGYLNTTFAGTGTGEDAKYLDVTISSVDPAKCFVYFVGGCAGSANSAQLKNDGSNAVHEVFPRLTSATNLRLATQYGGSNIGGRWYVLEFA